MTLLEPIRTCHAPDLLQRFVSTNIRAQLRIGSRRVLVETNDFNLLPALPLDTESSESRSPRMEWKIIRDFEARGELGLPVLLDSESVTVVTMGAACVVILDRERMQMSCFVGTRIDGATYRDYLVPIFKELAGGKDMHQLSTPIKVGRGS
jgi:hypothetical protein